MDRPETRSGEPGLKSEEKAVSPWSPEYRNRPFSWKGFLAVAVAVVASVGGVNLLTDNTGYYIAMSLAAVFVLYVAGKDSL